jgi:hypothetical protein
LESPDDERPKNPLRVNFNLRSDFKLIWVVQSPVQKHFAGFVGQISSPVRVISSQGGAGRDRHERGMGCGGRDSVGARVCSQGGFRERATARRTNDAVSVFTRISPEGYQIRRSLLVKRGLAYGKTVWS